jgi:hypothetical protein
LGKYSLDNFILILFFLLLGAQAKTPAPKVVVSPLSEKKSPSTFRDWDPNLKAEYDNGFVSRGGVQVLHVELNKENKEGTKKLLQTGLAADVALWRVNLIANGKETSIAWDPNKKAWIFKYDPSHHYVMYVSKRKNNIETFRYLWVELP